MSMPFAVQKLNASHSIEISLLWLVVSSMVNVVSCRLSGERCTEMFVAGAMNMPAC